MVGYEYSLNKNPLVLARDMILLADNPNLGVEGDGFDDFVKNMSEQITSWVKDIGTNPMARRWITLAINLYANLDQTEMPILSFGCIKIEITDKI